MIECLFIGDELLDGRTLNTNAQTIAQHLNNHGFNISKTTTVGDHHDHLEQAIKGCLTKAKVIITTGGLGPTEDDRTTQIIAKATQRKLQRDSGSYNTIKNYFESSGRTFPQTNAKQADFPEGALILDNPNGTAPGFALDHQHTWIFCLPGVPSEMKPMLLNHVIPLLHKHLSEFQNPTKVTCFKCYGIGESHLMETLQDLYPLPQGISISFQAKFPEIHLRLHGDTNSVNKDDYDDLCQTIQKRLSSICFSTNEKISYLDYCVHILKEQQQTIALAESCTGGLISYLLSTVPGASDILDCNFITYSNQSKTALLAVSPAILAKHGAVSGAVAEAMAKGALEHSEASIGLAVTGIAGPDGGSNDKPVGTVFIGLATKNNVGHFQHCFSTNRKKFQTLVAYQALHYLLTYPSVNNLDKIPTS
ncbi:competence/damage-inducible protein A [Candidatus Marinamargulisbacteria bacterium SCGC AG-414-C22]|nr:competence/damage-inducible protein A [Candidatus Marinamargulisbacteria bacterium SCGC AG-414-C22]